MTGMTITEFLLARIAEDEAQARAAINPGLPGTHWQWSSPDHPSDPDAPRWLRTTEEFPTRSGVKPLPAFPLGYEFTAEPSRGMAHIARWDPARVLAECAAKRAIIAEHGLSPYVDDEGRDSTYCSLCHETGDLNRVTPACPTLRALAAIHEDHRDYQDTWRV